MKLLGFYILVMDKDKLHSELRDINAYMHTLLFFFILNGAITGVILVDDDIHIILTIYIIIAIPYELYESYRAGKRRKEIKKLLKEKFN